MDNLNWQTHSSWDGHEFAADEAACGRCQFWEYIEGSDIDQGQCRRCAPRASSAFDEVRAKSAIARANLDDLTTECYRDAYWPVTTNYDWCGEFKLRVGPTRTGHR